MPAALSSSPPGRWLACLMVAALASGGAAAQVQRQFPQTALRGEIVVVDPPDIVLNGVAARLSPGARIRGQDNLLVMSGAIIGQKWPVHYTVDLSGLVHDVWLLRGDELARRPWPKTAAEAAAWSFDPAAQAWTKP